MTHTNTHLLRTLVSALLGAGLMAAMPSAHALKSFEKNWSALYPNSGTGDASCSVCHGGSNGSLNAYGKEVCDSFNGSIPADITTYLLAIQGKDSDGDPTGSSNIQEIEANAQPGWTTLTNIIYAADVSTGCPQVGTSAPPATLPLPYDPPVNGAPVADAGGLYTGNVNVPVTFDGSGSYDSSVGGSIASYTWAFGDGATVTGAEAVVEHTYATANTYIVSLKVVDNEGNEDANSTTATISAAGVLDLDIGSFTVTKSVRIGKPISIQLAVNNPGPVQAQALATVVGMMSGTQVYKWSLNVYDAVGGGTTSITFPAYTPSAKGTINWSVTIADMDPDTDSATATTVVK
jgi:hypothetical protein